jgi:hypothetical protein
MNDDPRPPPVVAPTVTYFAVSIFSSRTFWLNTAALFVAVSSLTEVVTIIPIRFMPLFSACVAIANVYLRTVTVRPAAFIAPGETVGVQVEKIGPPPPPMVTT